MKRTLTGIAAASMVLGTFIPVAMRDAVHMSNPRHFITEWLPMAFIRLYGR